VEPFGFLRLKKFRRTHAIAAFVEYSLSDTGERATHLLAAVIRVHGFGKNLPKALLESCDGSRSLSALGRKSSQLSNCH